MDEITADGQSGVSFMHPMGEIYLPPLAGEIQSDAPHHVKITVCKGNNGDKGLVQLNVMKCRV